MTHNRKSAIIAGVMYITGTGAGIASAIVTEPVRKASDILTGVATHENNMVVGALFILLMGLSLAMVPVAVYPVLKRYNRTLALGYVVFRGGLETFTYLLMSISWLLLPPLGRAAHSVIPDTLQTDVGTMLYETPQVFSVCTIVFIIGAVMFYSILYRNRLVPRWISLWGLVAAVPYLTADCMGLFGIIKTSMNSESIVHTVMVVPLAVQEMVLAIWLIARGFSFVTPLEQTEERSV